jgi:3-methylcrotonyl-CoA carboxylase alpha subunit
VKSAWRDGERTRAVEIAPLPNGRWQVSVDGTPFELGAETLEDGRMRLRTEAGETIAEVTAAGARRFVRLGALDFVLERSTVSRGRAAGPQSEMTAPMNGLVTRVLVAAEDAVKKGQPLVAIEAMKMEHLVRAPRDGQVRAVHAAAGAMVQGGVTLVELHPEAEAS